MVTFDGVIKKLVDSGKDNCSLCHKKIAYFEIYDHENGIVLEGYAQPQWFTGHCSDTKCEYDSALWKILK